MSDKKHPEPWTPSPVPDPLLGAARDLRRNMTDAEQLLWRHLRGRQLNGSKFRRQHPVDRYVLDFYCAEARLAVEVDGGQHDDEKARIADAERSRFLNEQGIRVLRFWNHEVLSNITGVLESIVDCLDGGGSSRLPPPGLPPLGGGELVGPEEGETLDDLRLGNLKILQRKNGYRFSLDPILLCAFTRIGEGDRVADLGTGNGVIPLVLARRSGAARIVGVERQAEMVERARRSVVLNGLQARVEIIEGDVRTISRVFAPQSFEVVVCNPPFRAPRGGRVASGSERAAARHELAGGLSDFVSAASWLLPDGGRFYVVYLAERADELLACMRQAKLGPKRLRCVHGRRDEAARMVLVEGRKNGGAGLTIEPPLVVWEGDGYTREVLRIYDEDFSED
ncbi:MAG: DUF559 domain-containing protein [Geoalkalibacter sp.]|uniref:DUF559 domain-containing protein n=1 Tax=Geoalkalibacter sp. TaxID=3041440 RepID=UPI003D0F8EF3